MSTATTLGLLFQPGQVKRNIKDAEGQLDKLETHFTALLRAQLLGPWERGYTSQALTRLKEARGRIGRQTSSLEKLRRHTEECLDEAREAHRILQSTGDDGSTGREAIRVACNNVLTWLISNRADAVTLFRGMGTSLPQTLATAIANAAAISPDKQLGGTSPTQSQSQAMVAEEARAAGAAGFQVLVDELTDKVSSLTQENESLEAKLDKLEGEKKSLESDLNVQRTAYETQSKLRDTDKAEAQKRVDSLSRELRAALKRVEELEDTSRVEELQLEKSRLEQEVEGMQRDLEDAGGLEERLERLKAEHADLRAENRTAADVGSTLRQRNDELQAHVAGLESQLADATGGKLAAQSAAKLSKCQADAADALAKGFESQCKTYMGMISTTSTNLLAAQTDVLTTRTERDGYKAQVDSLQARVERLNIAEERCRQLEVAAQDTGRAHQHQLQQAANAKEDLESKLQRAEKELEEKVTHIAQTVNSLAEVREALNSSKQEVSTAATSLEKAKGDLLTVKSELEAKMRDLQAKQDECNGLSGQLKDAEDALGTSEVNLQNAQDSLAEKSRENEGLQGQLDAARSDVNAAQRQLLAFARSKERMARRHKQSLDLAGGLAQKMNKALIIAESSASAEKGKVRDLGEQLEKAKAEMTALVPRDSVGEGVRDRASELLSSLAPQQQVQWDPIAAAMAEGGMDLRARPRTVPLWRLSPSWPELGPATTHVEDEDASSPWLRLVSETAALMGEPAAQSSEFGHAVSLISRVQRAAMATEAIPRWALLALEMALADVATSDSACFLVRLACVETLRLLQDTWPVLEDGRKTPEEVVDCMAHCERIHINLIRAMCLHRSPESLVEGDREHVAVAPNEMTLVCPSAKGASASGLVLLDGDQGTMTWIHASRARFVDLANVQLRSPSGGEHVLVPVPDCGLFFAHRFGIAVVAPSCF
ncbi:hypothetical protein Purlil1_940 [Purpureocillium lilacinum]|uniref:Uncharacterized protein n=1 Tax=Purpureocillium lilacinum TaxID=33203 RepID=A0ABR0CDL4_PURLI|nr:hypothetical protein Purlil1_940 [Purpureocillium lilacinum]